MLEKITSLTAVLSNKTRSISHKKLAAFVAEFSSSNISVVIGLIKFCKDFL
jgi:hypothetical protein